MQVDKIGYMMVPQEARAYVVQHDKHTIAAQDQRWVTLAHCMVDSLSSLVLLICLQTLVLLLCRTSFGSPTEEATVRLGMRAHSGGTQTGSPVQHKGLPVGSPMQTRVLPSLKMLQTPPNQQLQGIPTQVSRPVQFNALSSSVPSPVGFETSHRSQACAQRQLVVVKTLFVCGM